MMSYSIVPFFFFGQSHHHHLKEMDCARWATLAANKKETEIRG